MRDDWALHWYIDNYTNFFFRMSAFRVKVTRTELSTKHLGECFLLLVRSRVRGPWTPIFLGLHLKRKTTSNGVFSDMSNHKRSEKWKSEIGAIFTFNSPPLVKTKFAWVCVHKAYYKVATNLLQTCYNLFICNRVHIQDYTKIVVELIKLFFLWRDVLRSPHIKIARKKIV